MQSFTCLLLTIISVSFKFLALRVDTSNHCFRLLNTAHSGESESRVSGEQVTGESRVSGKQVTGELELASGEPRHGAASATTVPVGQAFELERKNEGRFTCQWLQKLILKFRTKRQRV